MSIEIGSEWIWTNVDGEVVVEVIDVATNEHGETIVTTEEDDGEIQYDDIDYFLANYKPKADMVNNPPHYKDASGVGCTEVVKHMMYFGGACFKYLYRCGNKWDDVEDLKKAVRCAELADEDRLISDESWLRAMYQVASHRDGNIQQAMFSIRCQQWGDVIEDIKAEIARLESEAGPIEVEK